MKKLFTFLTFLCLFITAHAELPTSGDYYLDMVNQTDKKFWFVKAEDGFYYTIVPVLDGDFKIFDKNYNPSQPDNDLIFGSGSDGAGVGTGENSIKHLNHPGNNLCVEGGGELYNVIFKFDPEGMTLEMIAGSSEPEDPPMTEFLPPLLIGQFVENTTNQIINWDPSVVIEGTYNHDSESYEFHYVRFYENGEFSFITKKGTSSTDWTTVNSSVRYVPPVVKQEITFGEWTPYVETLNGEKGSNQWYLPTTSTTRGNKYDGGAYYTVYFNPSTKMVMVEYLCPTGVEEMPDDENSSVDVMNMQGVVLKTGVSIDEATVDLQPGLYIIGNRKVAVR